MHTSSHGRFYFPSGPKRLRVRRGRSRTAAESVCGLDVNQSPSQPTKYIPLTVQKAPELTKLQAASYVGVRYTWPPELARETELRWKNRLFDRGWVRSAMATRKGGNIYFRKYFVAVRKFTNIFVLLLILMVGSRSIHYSSFASH